MGVSNLWNLLNPVKKEIKVADCHGKTFAVDLSAWIVQCSQSSANKASTLTAVWESNIFCFRNIFFRALRLLSLGVHLVFVMDGPNPPPMKKKTYRRSFYENALQYKRLLIAMGLPVLESDGEAEKLCAELDCRNIVDGVLTEDGDAFLYGAHNVYKGFFTEKRTLVASEYRKSDILEILGLTQKDLVAFALLSGCDFCEGVHGVGEKTFLELVREFRNNKVESVLERLKSWKSNEEFSSLMDVQNSLCTVSKLKHCSHCLHEGTKQVHGRIGCEVCETELSCNAVNDTCGMSSPCPCRYHQLESRVKPFSVELKIRQEALRKHSGFPSEDVINEFMIHQENNIPEELSFRKPDFSNVCNILEKNAKFTFVKTMSHLVPTVIKMVMHGMLSDIDIKPCIMKTCKDNFEKCYMISWQRLDIEGFSEEENPACTFAVPIDFFAAKFPEITELYNRQQKSSSKAKAVSPGKRKDDPAQRRITDMFKVVKKKRDSGLETEEDGERCITFQKE